MIEIRNACSAFIELDPLTFLCEFFSKDYEVELITEFVCYLHVYVVVNFQNF